jgi:hypothetical protein
MVVQEQDVGRRENKLAQDGVKKLRVGLSNTQIARIELSVENLTVPECF